MKNPYEESKSIEIPDNLFDNYSDKNTHNVSKSDVDKLNADINNLFSDDTSVNATNKKVSDDTFTFNTEENEDFVDTIIKKPNPKKKTIKSKNDLIALVLSAAVIILAVVCIVLFINLKSLKGQVAANDELYQNEVAKNKILETKISELEAEIEESKKVSVNNNYAVATSSRIRTGAGIDYSTVDYASLPSEVQAVAEASDTGAVTKVGVNITVLQTTTNGEYVWGEIAEGYWFCISQGSSIYANKVTN